MTLQQQPLLGVLGGMGPLATVDFLDKLVRLTPARRDQEHLPWITACQPGMPDRSQSIRSGDDAPLAWLLRGVAWLAEQGVQLIVIPCNSSHHWYEQIQAACTVPIAHIADAAVLELRACRQPASGPIAVLGTRGMIQAGIYSKRLAAAGYELAKLDEPEQSAVDTVIAEVKAGKVHKAREHMRELESLLHRRSVSAAILGCTELPIAHEKRNPSGVPAIDSSSALAKEALRRLGYLPASG